MLARAGVAVVALTIVAGIAYAIARETSLFSLEAVEVAGAPDELQAEVRRALAPLEGESLVTVDPADAAERAERLPAVASASADRDFPHTLRLEVTPERAVAVVRFGERAWVVSARGRLLREADRTEEPGLPRVWLPRRETEPRPGSYLLDGEGGDLVRVLARVPAHFPARVDAAHQAPDGIAIVLRPARTQLRLGDASAVRLKLAVAAAVLEGIPPAERRGLAYLDVSVPERPVSLPNSQVEASA